MHTCGVAACSVAEQLSLVHAGRVGVMHARGQGGSNEQRPEEKKTFNTKPLKIKQGEMSPDTGSTLYPSNLLCSQLPAPAISRGATGGHAGAIFAPLAPFLATAL